MSRSYRNKEEKLSWNKYNEFRRQKRNQGFNRRSKKLVRKLREYSNYQ